MLLVLVAAAGCAEESMVSPYGGPPPPDAGVPEDDAATCPPAPILRCASAETGAAFRSTAEYVPLWYDTPICTADRPVWLCDEAFGLAVECVGIKGVDGVLPPGLVPGCCGAPVAACTVPEDCPLPASDCYRPACDAGVCAIEPVSIGSTCNGGICGYGGLPPYAPMVCGQT